MRLVPTSDTCADVRTRIDGTVRERSLWVTAFSIARGSPNPSPLVRSSLGVIMCQAWRSRYSSNQRGVTFALAGPVEHSLVSIHYIRVCLCRSTSSCNRARKTNSLTEACDQEATALPPEGNACDPEAQLLPGGTRRPATRNVQRPESKKLPSAGVCTCC